MSVVDVKNVCWSRCRRGSGGGVAEGSGDTYGYSESARLGVVWTG